MERTTSAAKKLQHQLEELEGKLIAARSDARDPSRIDAEIQRANARIDDATRYIEQQLSHIATLQERKSNGCKEYIADLVQRREAVLLQINHQEMQPSLKRMQKLAAMINEIKETECGVTNELSND